MKVGVVRVVRKVGVVRAMRMKVGMVRVRWNGGGRGQSSE